MSKLPLFIILAIVIIGTFTIDDSFAFDPQSLNMTLNDVQTQEFVGYDIIKIDFNLFNSESEDISLAGHSTIFVNDTNGDYWELINYQDFGFTSTECPLLDVTVTANSTSNLKLCFLTTDEANVGYSLVIEDNDYFANYQPNEFVLEYVPEWFKSTTSSWCSESITESQFTSIVQTYIEDGVISVLRTQSGQDVGVQAPEWVKNNSCQWATDQISDYEFLDSIYWYIDNGKIQLN